MPWRCRATWPTPSRRRRWSRQTEEAFGDDLWNVVCNAGITRDNLMSRIGDDDWRAVIDTNLGGTFHVCKAASRKHAAQAARRDRDDVERRRACTATRARPTTRPPRAASSPSRRRSRRRSASRGIRVNCIAPGYIATELTDVLPEARAGRTPRPDAAGAAWRPRGRRPCRTVPALGRRRLHHGRGRPGRRRDGDVTMERRRVVVTGIGAVNAVGIGVPDFLQGLRAGPARRRPDHAVRRRRTRRSQIACEVKNFDADRRCSTRRPPAAPTATRTSPWPRPARRWRTRGSRSRPRPSASARSIGSGIGGLNTLFTAHEHLFAKGIDRFSPFWVPALIPNMGAAYVSIELGTRGPLVASCTACAASSMAIGDAVMYIRHGHGRRDARRRRRGRRDADGHRRLPRHAGAVDAQRRPGGREPAVRPRAATAS